MTKAAIARLCTSITVELAERIAALAPAEREIALVAFREGFVADSIERGAWRRDAELLGDGLVRHARALADHLIARGGISEAGHA